MKAYKRKFHKFIDLCRPGGRPGRHKEAFLRLLNRKAKIIHYGSTVNPVQASENSKGQPFVVNVPIERCRGFGLLAFPLTDNSLHPFVQSLNEYKITGKSKYEGSPLEKYYSSFVPIKGADVWGIKPKNEKLLCKYDVLDFLEPWHGVPSKQERNRKISINKGEAAEHDEKLEDILSWQHFGPVSYSRGKLEYERLIDVYESIKEKGYKRGDGFSEIKGVLLLSNDNYAVVIHSGQHRIAALLANEYKEIPIFFEVNKWQVVRRDKAFQWPAVKHDFLSECEAKKVFDRTIGGLQPFTDEVSKHWIYNG